MQTISQRNNLPILHRRTNTNRDRRSIHLTKRLRVIPLTQCHQLIINTDTLPITLTLDHQQLPNSTINIAQKSIQVKNQSETVNLQWDTKQEKWVRIQLGQTVRKVEVRGTQNQNRIEQTCAYPSINTWNKMEQKDGQLPFTLFIGHLLVELKNKLECRSRNKGSRLQAVKNMKKRMTERTHSQKVDPKPSLIRGKSSINAPLGRSLQKSKHNSISLAVKHLREMDHDKMTRNSTASNSFGSEQLEMRINKRALKMKNIIGGSIIENPTLYEELGGYLPLKTHNRPRFYEQIPFTLEEIELKRHKFESQCISKKQLPEEDSPIGATETQQTQVLQDIKKLQNSHFGFDDTLERGVQGQLQGGNNLDESGTLCQSVFQ